MRSPCGAGISLDRRKASLLAVSCMESVSSYQRCAMYCGRKGVFCSSVSIFTRSILRENSMAPVVMQGSDISAASSADPC